ncbi:SDR family NAD(P)-dependent oxidoreductase [Rubrivivax sp. JA1026]|uniref:SDR family NAD(P)-dependent oxidoreductase n=1 Tax=Rubrivivax sp. JA1026 TaxID=2710888 RepID=UPI0013E960F5|nr:SDR family oxidoreductase [Rubrivivax sp. JA1026]
MSARKYEGRTVLVTGSSRGVGALLTRHFLDEGAKVVGVSRGAATCEHERYLHRQADIADPDAVQQLFAALRRSGTAIDIAINNAAVLTSQYALVMPASAARSMVELNLLAPFMVAREAAKMMRKSKWGRIINISSMAVALEPEGDSVYAACKAGLTTLSNVLAREFAPFNVTCNTLGITAIESDMLRQLPRDKIDAVVARLPLPRYASFEDIANVIDFFASERSGYVTAQTLYLGGVH